MLLEGAEQIEELRRTWDPVMADLVPAHLTVTYPEETSDETLLLRRAESWVPQATAFRLRPGKVFAENEGHGGVFVAVDDVDGGWAALRRRLLAPPMTPVDFPPHVTIAHPRTSSRGPDCHSALAGRRLEGEFWVREVSFTETTPTSFTILRRFPLATSP
ncbi:2'-5' RNA ligase family protein [Thermomonospora cellulosilytica]|uniref:2'-5' RNA ligase family protein n=1 Tax=Thermomonospora cellulosilytica TaxID=1411118 RepID=A0A7W3MYA8_9ACTN|nr:2'-5' RNA ligase family protein [Thermomonospora cellulosilytica]MBA9004145.1 hypothetical protein [Thermomonospora cellulosilytica]